MIDPLTMFALKKGIDGLTTLADRFRRDDPSEIDNFIEYCKQVKKAIDRASAALTSSLFKRERPEQLVNISHELLTWVGLGVDNFHDDVLETQRGELSDIFKKIALDLQQPGIQVYEETRQTTKSQLDVISGNLSNMIKVLKFRRDHAFVSRPSSNPHRAGNNAATGAVGLGIAGLISYIPIVGPDFASKMRRVIKPGTDNTPQADSDISTDDNNIEF